MPLFDVPLHQFHHDVAQILNILLRGDVATTVLLAAYMAWLVEKAKEQGQANQQSFMVPFRSNSICEHVS